MFIRLAVLADSEEGFATACENLVQEHLGVVMRLLAEQARPLMDLFKRDETAVAERLGELAANEVARRSGRSPATA
jgi:hypothetical protein